MKTITLEQFHATLKEQGVPDDHLAFRCPICGTVQSAADLIAAGAGQDFAQVSKYLAFSCVGRFTGAGSHKKGTPGHGCDWTLGGLFQLHQFEVVTPDGEHHPRFEPATPEEALANWQKHLRKLAEQHQANLQAAMPPAAEGGAA